MLSFEIIRAIDVLFPPEARSAAAQALASVVQPCEASAQQVHWGALFLGFPAPERVAYWAGIGSGDGRDVLRASQHPQHSGMPEGEFRRRVAEFEKLLSAARFGGGHAPESLLDRARSRLPAPVPPAPAPPPAPKFPPRPAGERKQEPSRRPAAAEVALLQTILAEPDDDTPRLVFADWLEEHGDDHWAWAIRVHCATEPSRETWSTERSQANDILYGMRERLFAPLRELGFDTNPTFGECDRYTNNPIAWEFRRGFVGGVDVGGGDAFARFFLERVDGVFRHYPIQHLALHPLQSGETDNGFCPQSWSRPLPPISNETLDALLAHPCLLRLRTLDLSGNSLDDRAAELLVTTPNLAGLRQLKIGQITYSGYHGDTPVTNSFSEQGRARLEHRFGPAVTF